MTNISQMRTKNNIFAYILFFASLLLHSLYASAAPSSQSASWPRTLVTAKGEFTLEAPPKRIVSTSVTLSGTLLAIDAPLIASGATAPNTLVADKQGFFLQWSKVAAQKNLFPLYITEPNAEAIAAQAPDLIIIAASGGDSALKLYDQLTAIAPTLVIDYGDKSWQTLANQLGYITGYEANAEQIIAQFNHRVLQVKQSITLPPQPVSALVYELRGGTANVWTPESAQGQLLTELGFTLATVPNGLQASTSMGKRHDIIQLSGENLPEGLNGQTLLLFSADASVIDKVRANPLLSHLPAVQHQRLYAMGNDTFRLDYYSANNMLNHIEHDFSKP